MTALAQTLVSGTWLHAVQDLKQHGDLPLLQDSGVCSQEEVLAARMGRSIRKSILPAYKRHVVAPFFIGLDNKEFQAAAAKHLPSLGVCYSDLCPERLDQGWAGLLRTAPFSLWGAVQRCPLCQAQDATVTHCLKYCPATRQQFEESGLVEYLPVGCSDYEFLMVLLHSSTDTEVDVLRVPFVGSVVRHTILCYLESL